MNHTILPLEPISVAGFAPFGQVIVPDEDGAPFGPGDAQLSLAGGTPRFYAMRLPHRGRAFHHITRHGNVTQCLGSMMGEPWMLAVAPPDPARAAPEPAAIRAFAIPGDCFVMLRVGTWHAGPYFDAPSVAFYNLELADTNVVDHQTCDLAADFAMRFAFG